uniref:Uncharacterized protein n=1 Tax=Anguilla anguilla TaxID=7936 RepID=A0A0E9UC43_ANGAN
MIHKNTEVIMWCCQSFPNSIKYSHYFILLL